MPGAITDKFTHANNGTIAEPAQLSANKTTIDTTASLTLATGWPTDTAIHIEMFKVGTDGSVTPGTITHWKATLSGTTLSNMTLEGGVNQSYATGDPVILMPTPYWANDVVNGILVEHDQDGTHSDITATSITATTGTFTNLTIAGTASAEGWSPLGATPNTVTANGNRSYDLVFNGTDLTDTITEGMRLRTARTVAAPSQCATFDGINDYFSKSSPTGMTFTDDFSVSAWVKLTSYGAVSSIASRYNGTSGWRFFIDTDGTVKLHGHNASSANYSRVSSYQSIPLNRWVHVAAQLDMSAYTTTTTTSYVMIDGVDVPALVFRSGTNPTALVQAGNLEVGTENGANFFPGKIAQVAVYSAKVAQSDHLARMNQGLTGSEPNLISAYTLSNSLEDLSANNNDLTANGGVLATTADSPFGNSGVSTTLDYGIVMAKSFSTDTTLTVQVPEGCTIPTTGGVSTVDYSTQSVPYGFPRDRDKWRIVFQNGGSYDRTSSITLGTFYNVGGLRIEAPVGSWVVGFYAFIQTTFTSEVNFPAARGLLSTTSSATSNGRYGNNLCYIATNGFPTAASETSVDAYDSNFISVDTPTTLYILCSSFAQSGTSNLLRIGNNTWVSLECAYL